MEVGSKVGLLVVGSTDGRFVGISDGNTLGFNEGNSVGTNVGCLVGALVGSGAQAGSKKPFTCLFCHIGVRKYALKPPPDET